MTNQPRCIVCTRDPELKQKLIGFLGAHAYLIWTTDAETTLLSVQQQQTAILIIDLRIPQAVEFLFHLQKSKQGCPVIALAEDRSDPALEAERAGIYAMQSLEPDRRELQVLVERASEYLMLALKHRVLECARREDPGPVKGSPIERVQLSALPSISRAFRCLDDSEALFQHVLESLSNSVVASRAGLVARNADSAGYSLRASIRCLPSAGQWRFPEDGALARHFKASGQVMARSQLASDPEMSGFLRQALDDHAADAIVPLIGKSGLLGWFFVGARATGGCYDSNDLETLLLLGESLSGALEKTLLYEKTGIQKTLLESLFEALASGVLAVDANNVVLWLNRAAESTLGVTFDGVVNEPIEILGSAWVGYISRARKETHANTSRQVVRLHSGVVLELSARRFSGLRSADGLLLVIDDVTMAEALKEERERSLRGEMLAEMCENMAFSIRAPLTAIQSFAQLLPERHQDPEFCLRLESIVTKEVQRLLLLSDNIGAASRLSIPRAAVQSRIFQVAECIEMAQCLLGPFWDDIEFGIAEDLPPLEGNCERIAECICHLISNAREATAMLNKARIGLALTKASGAASADAVQWSIRDNRPVRRVGAFVDNSNLGSSETIRRADLRLSLASEIVRDHSGVMEVSATDSGVCITFTLPIFSKV